MHISTKTYDHNEGLSCCFRQPKATHSHCSLLHGYSLAFTFTFAADTLDDKNWVQDFGGLKELKTWLHDNFDHTWAVDVADPALPAIQQFIRETPIATLRVMPRGVGCERFAEYACEFADELVSAKSDYRVRCMSVEVKEHTNNSAKYVRE